MLNPSLVVSRLPGLPELAAGAVCLDPSMLRSTLQNLEAELTRTAETLAMQEARLAQMALMLIGTGPSTGSPQFLLMCQNPGEIRSIRRRIDQRRLVTMIPIEMGGVSLPRDRTVAERTALTAIALARQDVATLLTLVRAALAGIVPSRLLRLERIPLVRM